MSQTILMMCINTLVETGSSLRLSQTELYTSDHLLNITYMIQINTKYIADLKTKHSRIQNVLVKLDN